MVFIFFVFFYFFFYFFIFFVFCFAFLFVFRFCGFVWACSFIFVESFVRSQSQTFWTQVSLDATLTTNPLQGISNVFSEEIDSNHLRIGIAENVRVSFSSDERIDDFRVTITPATSIIDGPLTGVLLLLIIIILISITLR